jgi:protein ImuB
VCSLTSALLARDSLNTPDDGHKAGSTPDFLLPLSIRIAWEHVFAVVVCVLFPRFQLTIAAGNRAEMLQMPTALAPEPGGTQSIGEVSLSAEAFGVHPGMRLGEALARCPRLTLVPPDPAGVADSWERLLVRLESIGAAVEPERPGLVCFDARGLLRLHGGRALGSSDGERVKEVLEAVRRALRTPARYGVAPSRFAAVAAATKARVRRPVIVTGARAQTRAYLAPLPVALLRARPVLTELPEALERLGINTLGELAAVAPTALADRFGPAGLLAHELANGDDGALRPRPATEFLRESLELPEAASGAQLERGLGLLIDRLLARRERRGRTLRTVVLSAVLVEQGGTWREQIVFREALADAVRMRLALAPRLALMPAPAEELRLSVERFGPPASDQCGLLDDSAAARVARLREAIRQTRAAAGPDAALRVLEVDPDSRFPERRAVLAPFEG